MSESKVSPAPILQMATGYWASSILLTANRLGLFSAISGGATGIAVIAEKLTLAPYPLDGFLNALVSLGYLEKQGDGYSNTPISNAFLVEGRPGYLGNALKYSDDLYPVWGKLEETLRSGKPALAHNEILGDDPEKTKHFVLGMHNRALGIGQSLTAALDLTGRKKLLDVGGGPATYSCLLAMKNPTLTSRSMDLPAVVAIAKTIVEEFKLADRVAPMVGNYHQESYPGGNDVVLCSGMLHRETAESCRAILKKAFDALDPGGLVIVHDVLANEAKTGPAFSMLFGLNMALTAEYGTVHSSEEIARWMGEAGFVKTELKTLPPPWPEALVLGHKPE